MLYQKILTVINLMITLLSVYNAAAAIPRVPIAMRKGGTAFLTGLALLLGTCLYEMYDVFVLHVHHPSNMLATIATLRYVCWYICSSEFTKSLDDKVIKF